MYDPKLCYNRCMETSKEILYVDHTLEAVHRTDAEDNADSGQTLPPAEAWYWCNLWTPLLPQHQASERNCE